MTTSVVTNSIIEWIYRIEIFFAIFFIGFNIFTVLKKNLTKHINKYLRTITLSISTLLICDVITAKWDSCPGSAIYYLMVISNLLYFFSNYTTMWLFVNYAANLVKQNGGTPKNIFHLINDGAYTCSALLLLMNSFIPILYRISGENAYQRGDYFFLVFIPVIVMMGALAAILICHRTHLSGLEYTTILSYVIFPSLSEILQVLEPSFSWQPLAMAVLAGIILLQNFVERDTNETDEDKKLHQILLEGKAMQTRILLLVCIAIVCFFGFITKIAINFASNQMNSEIEAHYQMLANKTNEQASAWIVRETQILLNQKASLEIINNFDHDFLEEYFTYIVNDYNYDRYVYDMYFVNTNNEMASGTGYVQDPKIDFRERDWYVGALSSDNMCYTTPYVDVDTGRHVVTVSIKVFDRNRKFMGVLALDIFVEKLFSITEQQSLPADSYLFILDNELGLVTHPNENFGFLNESPQNLSQLDTEDYEILVNYIQNNTDPRAYVELRDYDGISRCFFVSKVDDCDWYIVAAISKDVIDESRYNMSRSIFIALIVCLILGVTLTLWATNNIIRKLTEAQDTARAASEAKSRFLANMSHEIRTPINAVLGMDEILLRECKDENLLEYAQNIQSAGQALLGVVNDILDFSKIESDRLDLVPGKYDLSELVSSCINLIQVRVQEKGLIFHVERDQYLPKTLHGDVVRVRQIISNLLTNAVKYTKEGNITLFIGWNNVADEQGELVIRVKDTGIGIKPESINDLFTSFQRLDEKKNRNIEGTGLGLSITKQLAELMGGKILVDSVYGSGSEFTVILPQKIIDSANTESFQPSAQKIKSSAEAKALHTKDASILVVDDVAMNLQVVKGLLKNTGLEIDTAERGREAIDMLQKKKYDIVFLDHMMPDLDGVETFRLIRKDYPAIYESTPIVMLTANAVLGVEEEYRNEGFAGYLSKPINREAICKCIMEHLSKDKLVSAEELKKQEDTAAVKATPTDTKPVSVKANATDTVKQDTNTTAILENKSNETPVVSEENSNSVIPTEGTNNSDMQGNDTSSTSEKSNAPLTMEASDSTPASRLEMFSKVMEGYNLKEGLQYCNNEEEFLIEMLIEYKQSDFIGRLQKAYDSREIKNYCTVAHSIKSTSRMIGFVDISDKARALEAAAKEENWEYIDLNHQEVCEKMQTALRTITQLIE